MQTLEVLHKFTNAEVIRPHLASLVPLLFDLIRNDNEDMGSLALKMFNELIRAARPAVDVHLPKFLALSLEHYSLGKELIDDLFGPKGAAMTEPDRTSFNKSFPSLRLIQEATILVAFIYQMAPAPLIAQLPSPPTLMEAAVNVSKSSLSIPKVLGLSFFSSICSKHLKRQRKIRTKWMKVYNNMGRHHQSSTRRYFPTLSIRKPK